MWNYYGKILEEIPIGYVAFVYEIKNLTNGKIYIGVHRTENIDDGYMGSGVALRKDQKEIGIENFERTILKFFESEEAMYNEEAIIVNRAFVKREDTYNLVVGGNKVLDEVRKRGGEIGGKIEAAVACHGEDVGTATIGQRHLQQHGVARLTHEAAGAAADGEGDVGARLAGKGRARSADGHDLALTVLARWRGGGQCAG